MKIQIPSHLLAYFEAEALKNFDKNGKLIETLAIGIGRSNDDVTYMQELIFPNQVGTTISVEDTGINGQPTSIWISENSSCFKTCQDATYVTWIHSHINGTPCGFSSTDIHNQFSYEQLIPKIIGCVVELGPRKSLKTDFFKLTKDGSDKVKHCQNDQDFHESCSGFAHPNLYKSVLQHVEVCPNPPSELRIFDARNSENIDLQISFKDAEATVKCNACSSYHPSNGIVKHIVKSRKCSHHLKGATIEGIRQITKHISDLNRRAKKRVSDSIRYEKNKKTILEKQATYDKINKDTISKKKAAYHAKNRDEKLEQMKKYNSLQRDSKKECEEHRALFEKEIQMGPVFPCVSCKRDLFFRGVSSLTESFLSFLEAENLKRYIDTSVSVNSICYICCNCKSYLSKKKMPPLCFKNGLQVAEIPDELSILTGLEKQLIKKNLPFLKVRQLPKTQMDIINDKCVNIPISDDDLIKIVKSLPRTKDTNGIINLKMKRKLKYKSYYKMEAIRPEAVYKALFYLKEHNPFYRDIELLPYEKFLESLQQDEVDDSMDNKGSSSEDSDNDNEGEENPIVDDTDTAFNNVTCLVPEDLSTEVSVNSSDKTIKKKLSVNSTTVYEVAPGENKIPNNWTLEKYFEEMCFPNLFPDGKNGFDQEREKKLSAIQYYCQRAMDHSGVFAKEEDYIFIAEQKCKKIAVQRQIDVSLKKGKIVLTEDGQKVMKGADAFSIFKSIPDTPSYWKAFRNEILARMEQFGPFHMFFTLSCAEAKWDHVIASILQKEGHQVTIVKDDPKSKSSKITYYIGKVKLATYKEENIRSMTEFLKKHYVLITRIFDNQVKAFFKNILRNHSVAHYSYRIEFQARGMPHVHGVFWLESKDIIRFMEDDKFDKEKVTSLIDEWISCSLDTGDETLNELVKEVNVHKHTKSCKKYGTNCRFNFPRLPSDETLIASPPSEDLSEEERKEQLRKSKKILEKVKNFLVELKADDESDLSLGDLLNKLDINYNDYKSALQTSQKGEIVILKRKVSERNVNNYNPCFIKAMKSNMDIQFVSDLHAVVTYVTDYFSKDDEELTKVMKEALKEKADCDDFERLNYMKRIYFTHRQVNVAQATYGLISGMNLKGSDVGTIFVSSGFPDNRFQRVYRIDDVDCIEDVQEHGTEEECEDKQDRSSKDGFLLQNRKGTFATATSIHEKYSFRPAILDNLCLAHFAVVYDNAELPRGLEMKNNASTLEGSLTLYNTELNLPKFIILENEKATSMKLRTVPKVLRIHKSSKKGGFEDIYAELLLFYPWRKEENLFHYDGEKCHELFITEKDVIEKNRQQIFPYSKNVIEITEFLESADNYRPKHVDESLDANAVQENLEVSEQLESLDTAELPSECNESNHKEKTFVKPIIIDDEDIMLARTRQLSEEQLLVLSIFVDYCKKLVVLKKCRSMNIKIKPPRVIVHGGGGVGKTFLINLLAKWAEKILRQPGDHPLKPKILIMGPTGMAANLIEGTTLNTGLGFAFGSRKYLPLRDARLESFRNLFEELELIIMDEMSMIKSDMLYDVQRRMEEIFISKDLFGGRSVMLVGDIMQLPPVKGRAIFTKPYSAKSRSMFNSSENLWNNFDVVTLKVSQRQKANEWRDCLNRIRIGELSKEDKSLLESRRVQHFPDLNVDNASHVFYTNLEVDQHNKKKLNSLQSDLIEIKAGGIYPRGYLLQIDPKGCIESTPFLKTLNLKKGARIMLTYNVNLSDGLVNGVLGTVLGFVHEGSKVKAIIIAFDDPKVGKQQQREHHHDCSAYAEQNGVPIYRTTLDHTLKKGGNRGKTIQFPLRLSWASTCHKLQGTTIAEGSDLIVHGHAKKPMPKNMYYVMLSRCSSLNNLYLDENVDLDQLHCDQNALAEKNRLDKESLALSVKEDPLDIFFVNTRSYSKHKEDISIDVFAKYAKCVCLVETWLAPGDHSQFSFENRTFYEASIGDGKGCCVILPKDAPLIAKEAQETFQLITFKYAEEIQVVVLYCSKTKSANLQNVKNSLKKHFDPKLKKLVIGDLNFDISEKNCLSTFFKESNLMQMVDQPTQIEGRTIDHLYVSTEIMANIDIKTVFKYYTDHAALQIKLK